MPSPLPEVFVHTQWLRGARQAARLLSLSAGPMAPGSDPATPRPAARWHATRNLRSQDPPGVLSEMDALSSQQPGNFPLYLLDVILLREARLPKRLGEQLIDSILAALDSERFQVLALAYERGTHCCLRLIVCRIHPETQVSSPFLPDRRRLEAVRQALLDLLESQSRPNRCRLLPMPISRGQVSKLLAPPPRRLR